MTIGFFLKCFTKFPFYSRKHLSSLTSELNEVIANISFRINFIRNITELRQKQMETAKSRAKPSDLTAKNSISIGPDRQLYIQCQQWGSGQKFLSISNSRKYVSKILVPHGAYKFVAAMDELIRQLPAEEPPHPEGDESPQILATQFVAGNQHYSFYQYNFKLSAWHQKGGEWHFDIKSVEISAEGHKDTTKKPLYFPFSALPWLRQQMVKLLEEQDGTERIDEMPTIPEWATRENVVESTENEEGKPKSRILANSLLPFGPTGKLYIKCEQGRTGHKTIKISMTTTEETTKINTTLPKIRMQQAAYKFVGAVDGLIGQLPAEAPPIPADRSPLVLENLLVEGFIVYDFQLSVLWSERGRRWDLHIRSVKTVQGYNEKAMHFPFSELPWVREQMATILAEHDGSEQIGEMPKIPEWATRDAPVNEQQEPQPNVEQKQVTKKRAAEDDDADEDGPSCSKKRKEEMHADIEKIGQSMNEPR